MFRKQEKGVFYLAFANSSEHIQLAGLKEESKKLNDILYPLKKQDIIQVERDQKAEIDDIRKAIFRFQDRITVFHFAGHAGENQLIFEDQAANARGLAGLLGDEPNLKLVFLNGCSTQQQANLYLNAGVPVLVVSTRNIAEDEAILFSESFYEGLSVGKSILAAFDYARHISITKKNDNNYFADRSVVYRGTSFEDQQWDDDPFRICTSRHDEKSLNWSIFHKKPRKWRWYLTLFLGMIMISLGLWYFPGWPKGSSSQQSAKLRIVLTGDLGFLESSIAQDEDYKIRVEFGTTLPKVEDINQSDTILFEVPDSLRGSSFMVRVENLEEYVLAQPDSNYVLDGQESFIAVRIKRNLQEIIKNPDSIGIKEGNPIPTEPDSSMSTSKDPVMTPGSESPSLPTLDTLMREREMDKVIKIKVVNKNGQGVKDVTVDFGDGNIGVTDSNGEVSIKVTGTFCSNGCPASISGDNIVSGNYNIPERNILQNRSTKIELE